LAGVAALAFTEIRVITRALLTSEVIGAVLVTILSIVILVKVIFSHGPTAYLIIGLAVVLVAPGLAKRVRAGLAAGTAP